MPSASNSSSPSSPAIPGVPLLDLARQHAPLRQQVADALLRVYDSGQFVLGPEVTELERRTAEYCHAKHAIGCASGSDALLLALMALEVGPGDEVIVPSFTFFATASAVTRLGARPVFADIEPTTFNIDPKHVERLMNSATKAILPVHLFGQCADMDALGRLANKAGVPIVEDAAQAIGAEYHGRRACSMGAIGCLSYYPTKNLGGAGDGGMLVTNDDRLADQLKLLRGHGMRPRYYHKVVGINSRLDSFQAAVLNVKLDYLDQWSVLRQANAQRYTELFRAAGLEGTLVLPGKAPGRRHVWNQYVVRVPEGQRDALRQWLTDAKIGSEIYYPLAVHQQECYADLQVPAGTLPETERAAREVMALPIFPELTAGEQKIVVDRVAQFYRQRKPQVVPAPKFLGAGQTQSVDH